jgi:NAD(P)-dependent dehydrogenase (short-subunit alcohol dehydrogenase family)
MPHPVLSPGRVAVITGAASGIGRAAARHFVAQGMNVCMADVAREALVRAAGDIVNNRPPLSRWHEEHAETFLKFQAGEINLKEAFPGV